MVEKVARTIAVHSSEHNCTEQNWKDAIELAKSAILAMREPTEEMCSQQHLNDELTPYELKGLYQAMIDAALKE